jgi:hypothetical protein
MRSNGSTDIRELSIEEQRRIDGGVMEGGCIDPLIQWMIDIINSIGSGSSDAGTLPPP